MGVKKNSISMIEGKEITEIGSSAFENQTMATQFILPNIITSIGSWAFSGCTSMQSVTFTSNSSLTSIGIGAFADSGLTMINLPASLVSIGNWAFSNCSSLIVTYNGNNLKNNVDSSFYNTKLTTNTQIPASVTTIGDWAFYNSAFSSDFALPNGKQI